MKKVVFLISLSILGCKETGDDAEPAAVAPIISQLQSMGCSAVQHGRGIHVSCADGSGADLAGTPGYFYAKDFSGAEYPNLVLVSGTTFYNKNTGDVLAYNTNGYIPAVNIVYFDQMGCHGNSYISDSRIMNSIILNDNAFPTAAQAFRVVGPGANITALSSFSGGACATHTTLGGSWSKIEAVVALDASSPATLQAPIQYMMAQ